MQAHLSDLEISRLLEILKRQEEADWELTHLDATRLVSEALATLEIDMLPERAMYQMIRESFENETEYDRALVALPKKFWLFLMNGVSCDWPVHPARQRAAWAYSKRIRCDKEAIKSGFVRFNKVTL